MMEAVRTSATTVYFNEITWRYFPEDYHLSVLFCLRYNWNFKYFGLIWKVHNYYFNKSKDNVMLIQNWMKIRSLCQEVLEKRYKVDGHGIAICLSFHIRKEKNTED
jgi:hypothetical protein